MPLLSKYDTKLYLREEDEGSRASSRTLVRELPLKQALELVFPLPIFLDRNN